MLCDELRRPRSKETLSSVASCELCNKTSHAWDFAIDDGVFELPDYSRTVEVPDASHSIYASRPKEVAALIEEAASKMDVNVTRRRSLGASRDAPDATRTLLLDFLRGLHSSD